MVVQTENEKQFVIEYVNDDGSVGMFSIGMDGTIGGTITLASKDDFLKKYKVTKNKAKLLDGYPQNTCANSSEFIDLQNRSTIVFALVELHKKNKGMTYACQDKLTKRIFASVARAVDGLCIVPLTTHIIKTDNPESASFTATIGESTYKLGRQLTETCVSEIFLLRHVDDRKSANMVLKTMIAAINTPNKKCPSVDRVCREPCGDRTRFGARAVHPREEKRKPTARPQ